MNVQNWYTTITDFEQNPYWLVNRTENEDKRARVLALASASFKVTDWLTLQGRGNIDYVNDKYQQKSVIVVYQFWTFIFRFSLYTSKFSL